MKPVSIACVSLATLISAASASASESHRIIVEKIDHGPPRSMREQIQLSISRFAAAEQPDSDSTNDVSKSFSQLLVKQQPSNSFGMPSRRSARIDAQRIPIQYNPTEVNFVGKVGVGTPPQYFRLAFEIGSADTWIAMENANCTNPEPCSPKRRYFSPHRSFTFEQTPNVDWKIGFSDESKAKGWLHSDVVQVAGFVIDRQVLGMANTMVGFRDPGVDGILGLGMRSLATHGDATPVENLIYDMGMKSEFGIWLGSGKQGGELNFGGNDPARYKGSLSYFDLPDKVVYWAASVLSIAVEDAPPLHPPNKGSTASSLKQIDARTNPGAKQPSVIFDTASNLILLPPRIATKVHQYIHNSFFGLYTGYDIISGSYTVPCNLNKDIWIELGPTVASKSGDPSSNSNTNASRFKIAGRDIVRERAGGISGLINTCQSGIQASRSNDDDWVLGNIWFMNNYMTLDHKHRQVGIAPAARPEDRR